MLNACLHRADVYNILSKDQKEKVYVEEGREKRRDKKMQFKKKVPAKFSGKAGLEKEQ